MTKEEKIAFYLPYKIKGIYRVGNVSFKSPVPDEQREKELNVFTADFFIKYCKPVLRPIEDAMEIKVDFDNDFDYFRNMYFGSKNFREYWKEFEEYGTSYWIMKAPFIVTKRLLEYGFDVFNMINDGLAISIHKDREEVILKKRNYFPVRQRALKWWQELSASEKAIELNKIHISLDNITNKEIKRLFINMLNEE